MRPGNTWYLWYLVLFKETPDFKKENKKSNNYIIE
jgi:hypothetical protein